MTHRPNAQPKHRLLIFGLFGVLVTFQQVLGGLLFTLHVKRGLVFLLSSLVSVLLQILRQIFALVSCHVPLPMKLTLYI